jgi:4'-phosphopantetheinyl transferase
MRARTITVASLTDAAVRDVVREWRDTLSEDERERARCYRRPEDGVRFTARRALLRVLAGEQLRCDPRSIVFRVEELGRPVIAFPESRLAFSVSQTVGLAMLALAWDCRIGIDAERVNETIDVHEIAREVFSDAELRSLKARPAAAFFPTWVRKEALLKALGTGLSGPTKEIATTEALDGWTLRDLAAPAAGVCAALAASIADVAIVERQWPSAGPDLR